MISIEQKVFKLGCESARPLKKTDKLLLVVNGKILDTPVDQVFKGYEQREGSIKGYSMLSKFSVKDNKLDNGNNSINFFNDSTKEIILVKEAVNPLIQWNNKLFTEDEIERFVTIISKIPETPEQGQGMEDVELSLSGKDQYEKEKLSLIQEGYTEHKIGGKEDLLFLFNKDSDIQYLIKVNEHGFENIDIEESESNDENVVDYMYELDDKLHHVKIDKKSSIMC